MKYPIAFLLGLVSIFSISCKKELPEYPKEVNITFEVVTSRNTEAIINTTIDNSLMVDSTSSLPYLLTKSNIEVEENSTITLSFEDNGVYAVDSSGSSWTDYNTQLNLTINGEEVEAENFSITESTGNVKIQYTFH